MAYDSKSHPVMLWHVISVKLNIGKKITRLGIVASNREKIARFQTYRIDVEGGVTLFTGIF